VTRVGRVFQKRGKLGTKLGVRENDKKKVKKAVQFNPTVRQKFRNRGGEIDQRDEGRELTFRGGWEEN